MAAGPGPATGRGRTTPTTRGKATAPTTGSTGAAAAAAAAAAPPFPTTVAAAESPSESRFSGFGRVARRSLAGPLQAPLSESIGAALRAALRVALRVALPLFPPPPQVPVPPRSPLPPQLVRLPGPPLSAPAPPHRAGPAPPARVRRAGRRAERLLSPSGSLGRGRPPVPFARLGSVAAQSHPACRQDPAGLGWPAQPPAGRGGRIGYPLLEVCRYPRCPMMGRVGAAAGARAAPCGRTDTDGPGWDRAIG